MAKGNKAVQILEQHLEKIALAVGLGVSLWVILTTFIMKPAAAPGADQSITTYIDSHAEQATRIAGNLRSEQVNEEFDLPEVTVPKTLVFDTQPLAVVNAQPLGPYVTTGLDDDDIIMTISIPTLPRPSDPVIELYRTRLAPQQTLAPPTAVPGQIPMPTVSTEIRDIDFVTVEATLPMAEIREKWQRRFQSPQLPRQPRFTQPIIAAVQLQRQRLQSTGSWGEWQDLPRLENDPVADKTIPSDKVTGYRSQREYQLFLENRENPETQLAVLQPPGYPLLDRQTWLPPSEMQEQRRAEEEAARGHRPDRPGGPRGYDMVPPTQPFPAMPTLPGFPGGPPGMPGPMAPGGDLGLLASAAAQVLQQNTVKFWAHDASGLPGEVYRYRIRVALFNPIAGKNWFSQDQQKLKNEVLLWFDGDDQAAQGWIQPQKIVRIPDRMFFFPKPRITSTSTIGIDVYCWQHGLWYRKTFSVSPGTMIGAVDIPDPLGPAEQPAQPLSVDFRTDHLLLDILPQETIYNRRANNIQAVQTAVLVIAGPGGEISRIPLAKTAWSSDLRTKHTRVITAYDSQVRSPHPTQPGPPGAMPLGY